MLPINVAACCATALDFTEAQSRMESLRCCMRGALAVSLAQVSMSSTSIVVKCLTDSKVTSSPHGQITIGTLILQVRDLRSHPAFQDFARTASLSAVPRPPFCCFVQEWIVDVLSMCSTGLHGGTVVRFHACLGKQQERWGCGSL